MTCPFMKRNAAHFQEMVRQAEDGEVDEARELTKKYKSADPDFLKKSKMRTEFAVQYMQIFGHSAWEWWRADYEGRDPF